MYEVAVTRIDLDIVIPTLNAARHLPACLSALRRQRIAVVDGGSTDATVEIARSHGAPILMSKPGRGQQLALGAEQSNGRWLLFLHADTVLEAGWELAAEDFITAHPDAVAAFTFALDDASPAARRLEKIVAWRSHILRLPYGDQGLLISRTTYAATGGFRSLPIMEDVELIGRVPRRKIHMLPLRAVTSADRYRQGGYWRRPLRNLACQLLWRLGFPARTVAQLYR